jgi:superfamily II DNA or RNA helicase
MTDHIQEGPRRDPRRLFSPAERAQIAARQHMACAVCGQDLPAIFHVHHVIPWADGGLTQPGNGIAVCPDCHLRAPVAELPVFEPRAWQSEALPDVLAVLRAGEFATVSAAPGAGKTLFTAWTYRNLALTGDVARLVVFVPNANLRTQWAERVKELSIFLDVRGTTERRNRDGVVLTYHALSDPRQVQQIIDDAADLPTLFVLDEVHHLARSQGGEAGAWALATARIVGDVRRPLHPVLNLSGTLFRSNQNERISTIRYRLAGDQVETEADYTVTAGRLIDERDLRHIKVLGFDAEMRVHAVNLARSAHAGAETIRAVDLDGDKKLRSGILAGMVRSPAYVQGILAETVKRLADASVALESAPVKGLVIADGIDHAEQVHQELAQITGPRHAFIAHGQMSSAEAQIEGFRESKGQAVMVAVQKITEGFDVPDICVLTYLRTWKAPLFVNQMVGRAMRPTDRERELDTYLPATILVPNESEIKAAFADVLVGAMRVLDAPPEPCSYCGNEVCACPPRPRNKICRKCGMPWRNCVCPCSQCGRSRHHGCTCPRPPWEPGFGLVDVDVVGDGQVVNVSVDGREVSLHIIDAVRASLAGSMGMPAVFIEQAADGLQQAMKNDPMVFLSYLRGEES